MSDDDELTEWVRSVFDRPRPPRDIVPGSGPTRADYIRWNDATGTVSEVTFYDDPVLDVDGIPTAMPEPTTQQVVFGGVAATLTELERVGLTPDDVPNIHIIKENR